MANYELMYRYLEDYTPTQNFYTAVFEECPEHDRDIDSSDMPQLHDILDNLYERESEIIKMWCGIDCNRITYCDIGKLLGITKGQAQRIATQGFIKLRRLSSVTEIKSLFATRSELKTQIADLKQQLDDASIRLSMAIKALSAEAVKSNPDLACVAIHPELISLDELGFSTRIYNCLRRYYSHRTKDNPIRTLDDLTRLSKEELQDVRNMGDKGVIEVEKKLSQYGLSLRPNSW